MLINQLISDGVTPVRRIKKIAQALKNFTSQLLYLHGIAKL